MALADLYRPDDPYNPIPQPATYAPSAPSVTPNPSDVLAAAQRSSAGYNQPNYGTPQWQQGGVDAGKWADQTHKTPKYEVLRYLDQFNPNQLGRQGLLALSNEAKQYLSGLGYQIRDEDKIFRNDIGEIDVLHGDRTQYGWRLTGVGNTAPGAAAKPPMGTANSHDGKNPTAGINGVPTPGSQFTDPLTRQYEALLQQQTALYQQQQQRMQAEAAQQEAVRAQTADAVKRLTEYMNQRVSKLQQPAYTGTEQEVLRTQMLDPLERDRQATRSRALDNIGSRGFDPSSGIAQELLGQVDRGYNETRAKAQGDIAYRQIQEERSREQEAEQLLKYLTQLPNAAARGDLDFVSYLDSLVNQPGQQALATSSMLADLPVQRTQLGIQALGLGGQPQSGVPSALALLQNAQNQRLFNQGNQADFWKSIGLNFL